MLSPQLFAPDDVLNPVEFMFSVTNFFAAGYPQTAFGVGLSGVIRCWLLAVFCLFSLAPRSWGGPFWWSWANAPIVVAGELSPPTTSSRRPPGGVISAEYSLTVEHTYKGSAGALFKFVDPYYGSTGALPLLPGKRYVIFVAASEGVKFSTPSWASAFSSPGTNRIWLALPWNPDTRPQIEIAMREHDAYRALTNRGDRVFFLLAQLQQPNAYLEGFVEREVQEVRATEAIPLYRQRLAGGSESQRLGAAGMMLALGDADVVEQLIHWRVRDKILRLSGKGQAIIACGVGIQSCFPEIIESAAGAEAA